MKKIILFAVPVIMAIILYDILIGAAPEKMTEIDVQQQQLDKGDLVLVNGETALQTEPQNIVQMEGTSIYLSSHVIPHLQRMLQGAKEEGVESFLLNSGYRSFSAQQALYDEKGADYALPAGKSEHNLGLAVDIGSSEGTMNQAKEGKWLAKHAADYGFILRYPEDKFDITGIEYEPWHFRYVGLPHSKKMAKEKWVLEEYLAYLQKKGSYKMTINKTKYEVKYISPLKKTLTIPASKTYALSGDNQTGVIVTIMKKK